MHRQPHTMLFQPERLQPGRPQHTERSLQRTHRAGNDDRRQVTELLQAHYVAGRLSSTELESRIEQALAAVSLGDLDFVLADLPTLGAVNAAPSAPPREGRHGHKLRHRGPHGEKSFRAHATSYLLVMVMLVVIWALTNAGGYFWPAWPMLGWGIGLVAHGLAARSRESSVVSFR